MKIIPKCFYDKEILKLIDEQVSLGYESYSSLNESDQEIITSQCIRALGNDAYGCIIDHENFNKTLTHLRKYILNQDKDSGFDLLNILRINAVDYFTDDMNNLFEERFADKQSDILFEEGLRPFLYSDNGETTWRKSA